MCVNFMTLALSVSEIQRGGGRAKSPPSPCHRLTKKTSLNKVKLKCSSTKSLSFNKDFQTRDFHSPGWSTADKFFKNVSWTYLS